jgi:beta-glucosidase
MVLLKNEGNLLPLDRDAVTKIAVIGPHADQFTSGNYSGQPDNPVTPLAGIRNHVSAGTEVAYSRGTGITDRVPSPVDREDGFSRGRSVKLDTQSEGDYLEFPIDIDEPGTYEISLRFKSFPSRGIHQLAIDGQDQGAPIDMYADDTRYDAVAKLGSIEFDEPGRKMFRFTVVGRNSRSSSSTGHFDVISLDGPEELDFEVERLDFRAGRPQSADQFAEAAELAASADVAIVYVGTTNAIEQEGRDRTTLAIPGRQEELIKAVVEANPKTIVVLMHAGPLAMPWPT